MKAGSLKATILGLITLAAIQAHAGRYECSLLESRYYGPTVLNASARTNKDCGTAIVDSAPFSDTSSAFFPCAGGVALSVYSSNQSMVLTNRKNTAAASQGTYAQLSILKPGSPENWKTRAPLHSALVEVQEGLPQSFILNLDLDVSNSVREQNHDLIATCRELK